MMPVVGGFSITSRPSSLNEATSAMAPRFGVGAKRAAPAELSRAYVGPVPPRSPATGTTQIAPLSGTATAAGTRDRAGIHRYGHAVVPMDEARASCAIDVSGRPLLVFDAPQLPSGITGGFDHELAEEFFRAIANAARLTLHVRVEAGTNAHHMIEAAFKAFARALRQATELDPTETGVPSTKGTLTA